MRLPLPGWQVDAAVLKLHSRRCTCLQFHPLKDNLVLSGDKHGQVSLTLVPQPHTCPTVPQPTL